MNRTRRCWSFEIPTTSNWSFSRPQQPGTPDPRSNAMQVSSPAPDVVALSDAAPIPGLGFLPVNAYVVHAEQPLLVDSGLPASRADFLEALWNQIDPADL